MARFGWIVAVERARHLETVGGEDAYFTVNLVRPWGDAEDPTDPRGPLLEGADGKLGGLWSPWTWTDADSWVTYGRFKDAGGALTWKMIDTAKVKPPAASLELDEAMEKAFVKAIQKEVKEATEKVQYPLSQAIEDHQTKNWRSHVHTLAPLTHWPARLSGGALRLTWFLCDKKTVFADCVSVVCFPKFTMKAGTVVLSEVQVPKEGTLKEGRTFKAGKTSFSIDYADDAVGFLALAAKVDLKPLAVKADGLELSQGAVSRSALQAAFTGNLLPIAVLAAWMDSKTAPAAAGDAPVQARLLRSLWAALGRGREYVGEDKLRPNVVEFMVNDPSHARLVRGAIEAGVEAIPDPQSLAAFKATAKALGEARTSGTWTQERHSVWADVKNAVDAMQDGTPKTAEEFRVQWLAAARLLVTEDGLREAMGVWLGNVLDPLFTKPEEIAAWSPVKEKLLRVGEFRKDLVMRAQTFIGSTALWDSARAVARKPGDVDLLKALRTEAVGAVSVALGKSANLPGGVEDIVTAAVGRFVDELSHAADGKRPRPRDRGLKLDFSGWDETAPDGSDQQIRGYAIGLCAGYVANEGEVWKPDTGRAQWLTDTALLVEKAWMKDKGGAYAWMHEAVGATSSNGEKLVSVEYESAPIATALSTKGEMKYDGPDPDGFKAVDFAWKDDDTSRKLPLLGYGLYYTAKATPLDNAGTVIDPTLRRQRGQEEFATELKAAKDVLKSVPASLQYLSSEAPGSPDLGKLAPRFEFEELSDETQAHAWQASEIANAILAAGGDPTVRVPTLQKVALLAAPQQVTTPAGKVVLFPDARDRCEFNVTPHGTHWAFIDRWLATDRLLAENDLDGSDKDLGKDADAIETFANTFREIEGARAVPTAPPYHPAVSAIGMELLVFGKRVKHEAIPIQRVLKVDGSLKAAQDKVKVAVVAVESGTPALTIDKAGKLATLQLPCGTFACLRFYSLVDEGHFKPGTSNQRYAEDLENTSGIAFAGYRAFSPVERWFETLPAWPEADGLPPSLVNMNLMPPQETAQGLLSPNLLVAELEFTEAKAKWAQWLKGSYIQRHEWHWTGYPVDFPSAASELPAWIPSLAGVESFREIIDVSFTTSFAGTEWRLGPSASGKAVVHRWALPSGARPTRYVAYLARPILRFKRWLNPKLSNAGPQKVEADIYACGKLVPGRMREGPIERLATPALKHSIPLTAAYVQGLSRGANGVMLVFDDAIRRTDDLARIGGLGDTLEIDLVDTRIEGVAEMGNNPIFHALEPQPQGGLTGDSAFGLTFDIGPNPKVAQTAIVVRPVNAGGRWVMAMARARRYILPETELGTLLRPDSNGPAAHLAAIATRLDGKELVPLDFVVDVPKPLANSLEMHSDPAGTKVSIAVPPVAKPDRSLTYRYLVSWHKARWSDGGDPKWRAQVVCLCRGKASLAWDRLGTIRGYQNGGSQLDPALRIERWHLLAAEAAATGLVRRIRISDYTEPRWLTFIGSFDNAAPGMATDYRFVVRGGELDKLEVAPGKTAALPVLRNRDASLADGGMPTFHLALVFRAVPDAVRLRTEEGTGELVACYFVDSNAKPIFLKRMEGDTGPKSLENCYAHIVTLQRTTSISADERKAMQGDTLTALLECAFPSQEKVTESTLRILPEYLGPIAVRG